LFFELSSSLSAALVSVLLVPVLPVPLPRVPVLPVLQALYLVVVV